jgi:hypothetical protein
MAQHDRRSVEALSPSGSRIVDATGPITDNSPAEMDSRIGVTDSLGHQWNGEKAGRRRCSVPELLERAELITVRSSPAEGERSDDQPASLTLLWCWTAGSRDRETGVPRSPRLT